MTKNIKISKDEKYLLESFESGEWKSVKNKKVQIDKYSSYARETMKKDKRINIRLNQKDLESIQDIAIDEGIPYQTLISSLIHKYVNGKLVDKSKTS